MEKLMFSHLCVVVATCLFLTGYFGPLGCSSSTHWEKLFSSAHWSWFNPWWGAAYTGWRPCFPKRPAESCLAWWVWLQWLGSHAFSGAGFILQQIRGTKVSILPGGRLSLPGGCAGRYCSLLTTGYLGECHWWPKQWALAISQNELLLPAHKYLAN